MSPTVFKELLSFVSLIIIKQSTAMRDPISPSDRLAVTFRYVVTGDAQCTVAASHSISPSSVSRIITEICDAIWTSLKIMLLAVCNAKYEFTMVDIEDSGRQSVDSIYNNSHLGFAVKRNTLNFSNPDVVGSN